MDVMLVELDALADEPVEGRRLGEPAVPADVAPAEVVGDDQQDVRPARRVGGPDSSGDQPEPDREDKWKAESQRHKRALSKVAVLKTCLLISLDERSRVYQWASCGAADSVQVNKSCP